MTILQEFVNILKWEVRDQDKLDDFNSGFEDLARSAGQAARRGILAAGAAATTFLGFAVNAAAAAEELDSQLGVVFGDNADRVREWAEITGDALGRSTQEIQRGVVAFQSLFDQAIGGDEAVQLAQDFAVLTQDLASFKDLSNEVAQQKLFSGLAGEAEPLRQVGVFINAAETEAEALALGLARTGKELTDQDKIVARASLIRRALSDANGDVIRTQDSTTNSLKEVSAQFEELRVTIGQDVLPIITPLIKRFAELIEGLSEFNKTSGGAVTNILLAAAGLAALLTVASPFVTLFAGITKLVLAFNAVMAASTIVTGTFTAVASPLILIILAIIAAIAAVVLVWRNWDKIVDAFRLRLRAVSALFQAVGRSLTGPLAVAFGGITFLFQNLDSILSAIIERIKTVVDAVQNAARQVSGFIANNPALTGAAFGPAGLAFAGAGQAARSITNSRTANSTTVRQDIKNEINVRGGVTNAQTGRAVRDALNDGQRASRLNGDLVGPVGL